MFNYNCIVTISLSTFKDTYIPVNDNFNEIGTTILKWKSAATNVQRINQFTICK